MLVRVMFFNKNSELLVASEEQKLAFNQMKIKNSIVENGYIDIDTQDDPMYINLLLNSDVVEIFDGVYNIKSRQFRAMSPYALWVIVGEKVSLEI